MIGQMKILNRSIEITSQYETNINGTRFKELNYKTETKGMNKIF